MAITDAQRQMLEDAWTRAKKRQEELAELTPEQRVMLHVVKVMQYLHEQIGRRDLNPSIDYTEHAHAGIHIETILEFCKNANS